ncbi:hypothetical protein HKW67_15285 [Gemmatimonas groenlandica]|uniref:KTSC domain-containing protein n=1 Tax=Gemmatimonas groenlandica TaxID=2732249 RepID=A0A6M4IVD8_9BACT|nr:hypothetical protein HKW67_15285 [Gemmatimonas groenlandica]
MQVYRDLNGDSGVDAYETGDDFIRVQFSKGSVYLYTDASAGREHIEAMKELAARGEGLNTYINKYVRKLFARNEK